MKRTYLLAEGGLPFMTPGFLVLLFDQYGYSCSTEMWLIAARVRIMKLLKGSDISHRIFYSSWTSRLVKTADTMSLSLHLVSSCFPCLKKLIPGQCVSWETYHQDERRYILLAFFASNFLHNDCMHI
jgi:hypothetical protein